MPPPAQTARSPEKWPFERFPSPPLDGHWIPRSGPPPPSKFPDLLPRVPLALTLDPPVMSFKYPPPPPLTLEDPTWLNQMRADLVRQRSHLEMCLAEAQSDAANAYVEAGLAESEQEEEIALMQAFLDMVAGVAGNGFVERMLESVNETVEDLVAYPPGGPDSDSGAHDPILGLRATSTEIC